MFKNINISDYPTLENCSFGAVRLTKNADINKYNYSGYGIAFDRHGCFSSPAIGLRRNVIVFGVDMSSSTKIDNRRKDISILGKGPTQWLQHTLSAKTMYLINFTEHNKKFCLSFHYNGVNSHLFDNGEEIITFCAKIINYKNYKIINGLNGFMIIIMFMILVLIIVILLLRIY